MFTRKIRMGMIGGGPGSFIGAVHRMAANLDGQIELVSGAFSSNFEKSKQTGSQLFLDPQRVYKNYEEMILNEAALPTDKKIDFISIVTPNHLHFEQAKFAMENGFNVVCDKPITISLPQALILKSIAENLHKTFCLTHTYTGYPMIKEARWLVNNDTLGTIRKVYITYPQGWLNKLIEADGHTQAVWRTDPLKSGKAGSLGDIGTHAFNLAEYITGLKVTKICADVRTIVHGRKLDDDNAIFLEFNNGASGVLIATQIATGEENNLSISIYGDKGGIQWQQKNCNNLVLKIIDKPENVLTTGSPYLSKWATFNTRLPAGHPEGYIEAFANIYRNFALTLQSQLQNQIADDLEKDFPGIDEGIRGMQFIETVINHPKGNWVNILEC